MKGVGELKILQGTHVFSQMDGGRENTVGDSKIPQGTSKGTSTGSVLEGCNFGSRFKAKHAQSQCLEESQNCFESKIGEGFRFIDLNFLIEQLRRGCCTCKGIISHANYFFF